jgi:hypothetical protein
MADYDPLGILQKENGVEEYDPLGITSKKPKEEGILGKIGKTAKGVLDFPEKVYREAALPFAENVTSQAIGGAGALASIPVAARNYLTTLLATGEPTKAFESAQRGVKEVGEIAGAWKPKTRLGKESAEYSGQALNYLLSPIAETAKREATSQARQWGVPESVVPAIAATAETGAEFAGFGALMKGGLVKNQVRKILAEKKAKVEEGLKGLEGVVQPVEPPPVSKPVSSEWMKERVTEMDLQETLRPKEKPVYATEAEEFQRYKDELTRKQEAAEAPVELPEGELERPAEVEIPKPYDLSSFDQMKLETLSKTDPALWSASDRVFMQKLEEGRTEAGKREAPSVSEDFVPEEVKPRGISIPLEDYAGKRLIEDGEIPETISKEQIDAEMQKPEFQEEYNKYLDELNEGFERKELEEPVTKDSFEAISKEHEEAFKKLKNREISESEYLETRAKFFRAKQELSKEVSEDMSKIDTSVEEKTPVTREELGQDAEERAKVASGSIQIDRPLKKSGILSKAFERLSGEAGMVVTGQKKPFYSKLEEVVNTKMRMNMDVGQLKKTLLNNGVTTDEVASALSGLSGKVSKKEVLENLEVNRMEFEDKLLGEEQLGKSISIEKVEKFYEDGLISKLEYESAKRTGRLPGERVPTQYEQYSEPGYVPGSYRELFATKPTNTKSINRLSELNKKAEKEELSKEERFEYTKLYKENIGWQDGHIAYSDIQNPIVRIRFNEREVDGKRILFVEEIQGPSPTNQAKMPEALQKRIYDIGVKRVLAYAKENGFDGVSWTSGKMQADRYNLAKVVDSIDWWSLTTGEKEVGLTLKNADYTALTINKTGKITQDTSNNFVGKQLDEVVGKSITNKILSKDESSLSNLDLEVGGEGLKRLYDKTLPEKFKKYGKEDVVETTISKEFSKDEIAQKIFHLNYDELFPKQRSDVDAWATKKQEEVVKVPYTPITSKTPNSFTLYSDPFGAGAATKAVEKAITSVVENTEVKKTMKDIGNTVDEYLGSISTRLGNIDPSIKYKLREFEFGKGLKASKREERVLDFIKSTEKMSKEDYKALDTARKNGSKEEINRLVEKYGLGKEHEELRKVLDELYSEGRSVGYKFQHKPDYHPREVVDSTGLLEYLYGTDSWSAIDSAIKAKEKTLKRYLTDDEKVKVVNSMLRGYSSGQVSLAKPGQLKVRTIEEITPELDKFYGDSNSALLRYINDVTDAIEARRLFGKTAKKYEGVDVKNSIGAYVLDLVSKGKITPAQERTLKSILEARFNEAGTSGAIGLYKNLSYIDTMGSFTSAITQLGDAAFSMYKFGIPETLKSTAQAVAGKSKITKKDLGIEKIAAEFSDKSLAAKAVDKVFTAVGLSKIDSIFKETAINAAFNSAVKKARNPKTEGELRKKLEQIFEDETGQVLEDFKNGEVNDNTKLYTFNELADIQPISLSEMPQKYLTGGNGRIFYMLKTYTLKMFDVYRNEAFKKIATEGQRAEGVKNLLKLSAYLVTLNAGADVLKDLLLGRPIDLEDHVVDNIYRLAGASRFTIDKAKMEGLGTAAAKQILPPFKTLDAITKDLRTLGDEKGFEVTQSIPVFGKMYYWWFGKGVEKSAKKEKKMTLENYYKQATKELEEKGEVSQALIDKVTADKRLNDKDIEILSERVEIGNDLVFKVKRMPFEKALKAYKSASKEDRERLNEILDEKYERLSEEDQNKYKEKIEKLLEENKQEERFSIRPIKDLLGLGEVSKNTVQ